MDEGQGERQPGVVIKRRYLDVQEARESLRKSRQDNACALPDVPVRSQLTGEPLIDIVIPTFDNADRLLPFLESLFQNTACSDEVPPPDFKVWLVNNGSPSYLGNVLETLPEIRPRLTILEAGGNRGWEGGLSLALEHARAPLFMMANDDLHIVPGSPDWLAKLASSFWYIKRCGMVGPCSNVVMQRQNMLFMGIGTKPWYTSLLVGFCVMIRRDLLDAIGGITLGLPGGDDLDLSIRVEQSGWHPVMRRDVFVYHHGFTTGSRVHGSYWNSAEMQERTRNELIRRHGLPAFLRAINANLEAVEYRPLADALSPMPLPS